MMRSVKKFFHVEFKIAECEDNVYSSDEEEEDEEGKGKEGEKEGEKEGKSGKMVVSDDDEEEKPEFPKSFIFSCMGIGLTNISRKTE